MDIDGLFTPTGMRAFTATQRDQHLADATQYGQLADIVRRRLAQTPIEGDSWLSARFRAWKVAREITRMQKHSRKAAASAEALNTTYVNRVLELPGRRELAATRKAEKKAGRQGQAAALAAKSLEKGLAHLTGATTTGGNEGFLDAQIHQFPTAAGAEQNGGGPRTVNDFFPAARRQGQP
ncbi:hypothetical protein [Kitasatospora sp. NPDC004272]